MTSALDARRDAGRQVRREVPRRALAEVAERPSGFDPVARILEQGEGRVAALLPLRYQRMAASPFAFYRGCAAVMAEDLARGPSTSLEVQISGDAHADNFGVFASPERRLVFDLNDFDETAVGPFEWDLKRLVASMALVSEQAGADRAACSVVAQDVASAYQRSMARFATASRLDVWYAALDVEADLQGLRGFFTDSAARGVDSVIRRARNTEARTLAQMVTSRDGGPAIRLDPPHVSALGTWSDDSLLTRDDLDRLLAGYAQTLTSERRELLSQFRVVDAAHLVRGVGSVGTQCFVVLLVGRDEEDLLMLQVKEAQRSVVSAARGQREAGEPGERVVSGQRLMQATPDVLLGWYSVGVRGTQRSFYVRQLFDQRAEVDLERLALSQRRAYGRACAWVLARAHARTGRAAEIAGYLGEGRQFARSLGAFALAYRDRNDEDFRAFADAIAQGRVSVAT